jgi:hypothetical protein
MKTELKTGRRGGRERRAFTLLEVMIAIGVLFMAVFAILGLVSSSLENARRLQHPRVDASPIAGYLLRTNKVVEGIQEYDLGDFLGSAYKGYRVTTDTEECETNRLFKVDFVVQSPDFGRPVISKMTLLLFSPHSPAGSLDGATVAR